jgi:hypothetical protein
VLAIWDVTAQTLDVHRNIVPQQGIVSLVRHPASGLIVGGSTISGGLGIEPSAQQAVLFGWDDARGEKVFEIAPVPGAHAITALLIGPDGNVWGDADGTLFIVDPVQRKVVETSPLMSVKLKPGQHVWRGATMAMHPDGQIYGTMNAKFFRLDPATKQITILRDSGDGMVTFDSAGRIYLKNGTDLWQYTPAK